MLCALLCETTKSLKNSNSTNTKSYIYDLGWKLELVLMPKFNFYADKNWWKYSSFCLFQTTPWESLQCLFNLCSTQCLFFFHSSRPIHNEWKLYTETTCHGIIALICLVLYFIDFFSILGSWIAVKLTSHTATNQQKFSEPKTIQNCQFH